MKTLVWGILLSVLAGAAHAQSPSSSRAVEDRIYPRPVTAAPAEAGDAQQDALFQLVQQVQRMEEQLQQLQGQLEEMRHELDSGRQAERERYQDLDRRINELASSSPAKGATASAQEGAARGESSENDLATYTAAREKLLSRDFAAAGKAFEAYLKDFPEGEFRPFAHFWLGEIYRSQQPPAPAKAMAQFQAVVDQYPDHVQLPAALYKLAALQAEAGETGKARVALNRILQQFPGSSEARLARTMLDELK